MKRPSPSVRAWALPTTIGLLQLATIAIVVAASFQAAAPQDGFYPPLPHPNSASIGFNGPTPTPPSAVLCDLNQEFENVSSLTAQGWIMQNNSEPGGITPNWFQGNPTPFAGRIGSYIAINYQSGSGLATISNWLMTPTVTLQNNTQFRFWTRTVTSPQYPDRLQVRLSTNGASSDVGNTATSVGDFTTLLLDIDPGYVNNGYPTGWALFSINITGLSSSTTGRIAFRYFVENSGPNGVNSDYIGIDGFQFFCAPTTPTPAPVPSSTPCSCGGFNVYGSISNCANPNRPRPASGVILSVDGGAQAGTNSNGDYAIHTTVFGFDGHLVTPSRLRLSPGASSITTTDVIAIQRHFLGGVQLTGCRLTAGDVDLSGTIDTVDVLAIQRFYLGLSTGIANVGTYSFSPVSHFYFGPNVDAHGQNFDSLVYGDVAPPFVQ